LVKSYKRIDFFDAVTTIGNRILSQSSGDDQVSKTKKSIVEGCLKGIASDDPNRVICKLMSASTLIELPKEEKKGPSEEEKKAAEEKKKQQEAEKQKKAEEQKKQQEEAKKKKEEEQKAKQQQAQQNGNNKELVPVYRVVQENGETIREVEKIPMNDFMELVKANLKAGKSIEFT
jgi:Skp family chaperone for outer membrane proteins